MKILYTIVFFLATLFVSAEGSKQLAPNGETCRLRVSRANDNYGYFATLEAPEYARLQFSILNTTERVYFGFKAPTTGITYNIKDSLGGVRATGILPTVIGENGYIETWAQANLGPNTIAAGGYPPLTFNPPFAGKFYIEFSFTGANTREFEFFDITVATAANVAINGRVWSKKWSLTTGSFANLYKGKMYPYSNDRIVTEIDFNGIAPYTYTVSCNPKGCDPLQPFLLSRRSRTGSAVYAQYPIFLNNPDVGLFPTGVIGSVDSVHTQNECDGNLDFLIYVNKSGTVDIMLDINPLPGFQPEDISLNDSVYSGIANIINWNGLNGLGVPVPNGTTISIVVSYVNGLTNLPMYDVENDASFGVDYKGLKINLIRPPGPKPLVYWDDAQVGGTVNLTGCNLAAGCHSWGNSVGNNNTINSWWYSVSMSMAPVSLQFRRSNYFETSVSICEGDSLLINGIWQSTGGMYYDSLINFMGCDSVYATNLTVKPAPIFNIGNDTLICQGNSVVFDAGSNVDIKSYAWSTGANTQTITASTTGTYTCTVTYNNLCQKSDSAELTVSALPPPKLIKHY